ncbi:MAG: cytochrome c [Chlorobi bacterium]|nr:cytochrome c [Chlorobiota bacterium]
MKRTTWVVLAIFPMILVFLTSSGMIIGEKESSDSVVSKGEMLYNLNCAGCHGPNLEGRPPVFPPLTDLSERMTKEEVKELIVNGRGSMPPLKHLSEEDIQAIIDFLWGEEHSEDSNASGSNENNTNNDSDGTTDTSVDNSEITVSSAPLSLVAQGEIIYKSHCAGCHPATPGEKPLVDTRNLHPGREPVALAGITKYMPKERFNKILDEGPCYMPSFEHLTTDQRDALWAYLDSLSQYYKYTPPPPCGCRTKRGRGGCGRGCSGRGCGHGGHGR